MARDIRIACVSPGRVKQAIQKAFGDRGKASILNDLIVYEDGAQKWVADLTDDLQSYLEDEVGGKGKREFILDFTLTKGKVGQIPLDPASDLLLCAVCGESVATCYGDFPGLCGVCAGMAHNLAPEGVLQASFIHSVFGGMIEELEVLDLFLGEEGRRRERDALRLAKQALTHSEDLLLDWLEP